jgi:hypothetical protein
MSRLRRYEIVPLLVCGLGVGWLIGMSVSPVLHIVVSSVIALVVGATSALAGTEVSDHVTSASDETAICKTTEFTDTPAAPKEPGKEATFFSSRRVRIDPTPLAFLIASLIVGSAIGVYARTNDLFGPNPKRIAQKWRGTGLEERDIERRIFDTAYPPAFSQQVENGQIKTSASEAQVGGVLYGVSVSDCQWLQGKHGDELGDRLKSLNNSFLNTEGNKCGGQETCLEVLRDVACQQAK